MKFADVETCKQLEKKGLMSNSKFWYWDRVGLSDKLDLPDISILDEDKYNIYSILRWGVFYPAYSLEDMLDPENDKKLWGYFKHESFVDCNFCGGAYPLEDFCWQVYTLELVKWSWEKDWWTYPALLEVLNKE